MFNLFGKKSSKPVPVNIRDTLYGDYPLTDWPGSNSAALNHEPWSIFVQARDVLNEGHKDEAIRLWQQITEMPNLESRHYVQAWHFLRQQGIQPPPEKARTVYGVVAEVPVKTGIDLLAAYQDGSARYYNYTGAGVIWEHPDSSLEEPIKALLLVRQKVAEQIGPWQGVRPPLPEGQTRITMLTPNGLYFGQGKFEQLNADPMGKYLIGAATNLMVKMTEKATKRA